MKKGWTTIANSIVEAVAQVKAGWRINSKNMLGEMATGGFWGLWTILQARSHVRRRRALIKLTTKDDEWFRLEKALSECMAAGRYDATSGDTISRGSRHSVRKSATKPLILMDGLWLLHRRPLRRHSN